MLLKCVIIFSMGDYRAKQILEKLKAAYPTAECELEFDNPFHLLVSVILSAQCTDKRVNLIAPQLFKRFDTPADFVAADVTEIEQLIYSCGFYHNKAKNIKNAAYDIMNKFGGEVPNTFEQLLSLAGVGRKTANVVMAVAFKGNNIAVDTHVFRTSKRLGLATGKNPFEVEQQLCAVLDESDYSLAHHLLIFHGRYCCKSQKPECNKCSIAEFCKESPLLTKPSIKTL